MSKKKCQTRWQRGILWLDVCISRVRLLERVFLRILLFHEVGVTLFAYLSTINGVVRVTFQVAAKVDDLLDDEEWHAVYKNHHL